MNRQRNIFSMQFLSRATLVAALVLIVGLPLRQTEALTTTPRLEINANPGETVHDAFRVQNEQRQSLTYFISYANFSSQDESGSPTFSNRAEDLATWITTDQSITIGPGETKDIPVTINIPVNADPGGHYAAIFLQTTPPGETTSTQVSISAKLGTLILLRVGGEFLQDADVLEFGTLKRKRVFTSLPITFYYRFQNTGEDHVKPLGDVIVSNTVGRSTKILPANPVDGSVLPKSIRRFETSWVRAGSPINEAVATELPLPPKDFWGAAKYQWHNFALGKYKAGLSIVYGTKELKSQNASFTFFVIPWQLLVVAIPSGVVLLIILWFLIKWYNRYIVRRAERAKR
jgi:hypothetical protein